MCRGWRAVDRDKALLAPWRRVMQRTRQEFLARARFTQQHGCIGRRDLLDHPADLEHFRRAGDDSSDCAGLRHQQTSILELEVVDAERTVDDQREDVGLKRLGEEIVAPSETARRAFATSFWPVRTMTFVSALARVSVQAF